MFRFIVALGVSAVAFGASSGRPIPIKAPYHFEPNRGQTDPRVRFVCRSAGYDLFLTAEGAVLGLHGSTSAGLAMKLVGGNPVAEARGLELLAGASNYLIGSDPKRWATGVSHYAKVEYRQVYPGVDLIYYGKQDQLEHDFVVAAGGDWRRIRIRVEGAQRLRLDAGGDLLIETPAGVLRQKKPAIYQEIDGQKGVVAGGYAIGRNREFSFEIGDYDRTRPLIIDPVIYFATYLGGSGVDQPLSIAVDDQGNAYSTGVTTSLDFPTKGPVQAASGGKTDLFVTKLDSTYGTVIYSTYLGGSDDETPAQIKVDRTGNAYVAGTTYSANFPTTQGAFQTKLSGLSDAFAFKLNAAGNALVYSTYLGGSSAEAANALDLDPQGNAYLAGYTLSEDFPITKSTFGPSPGGGADGFVTKVNAAGNALVYSGYLGGRGTDWLTSVAVNLFGEAYVVGSTTSTNLPTTVDGSRWPKLAGGIDTLMAKISPRGDFLGYISYYGGSQNDLGGAVIVDPRDPTIIYISGITASANLPTPTGKTLKVGTGQAVPFVAKFGIPAGILTGLSTGAAGQAAGIDDFDWLFDLEDVVNYDQLMKKVEQQTKDLEQQKKQIEMDLERLKNLESNLRKLAELILNEILSGLNKLLEIAEIIRNILTNQPAKLSADGVRDTWADPAIQQAVSQQPLFFLNTADGTMLPPPQFPAGTAGAVTSANGIATGPSGSIYVAAATSDATLPVSALGAKPGKGAIQGYIIKFADTPPPPPPPAPGPTPAVTAVTNAGGFAAGAPVAPGSIVALFGTLLASGTAQAGSTPLPTSLGGTSVTISGKAAPLFFVSPTQVNAEIPWETAPGSATAMVTSGSTASTAFQFTVAAASPGIFTFGTNRAVVQNQDFSVNNTDKPAAVGSFITVYVTGGGAVDNPVASGAVSPSSPLARVTAQASATIGGQSADVVFLGLTPGLVGVVQANLKVPPLSPGDYPLVITIGGARSNAPLVTVSGS